MRMRSDTLLADFTSNEAAYLRRQVFARPSTYANGKSYPHGYRYYLDPPTPNPPPDDMFFLLTAVEFWLTRYIPRMHALNPPRNGLPPLADSVAQDLLIARTQSRNRLFTSLPDLPAAQLPLAESLLAQSRLDINTLIDIPSYGPSFLSLWADAKAQGLSDPDTLAYIWKWAKAWPSAWERDDERKQKGLPPIDPEVESRLRHVVAWRPTEDMTFPWEAHPEGRHWRIRLNDFPDDHMYTLVVNGAELGDFDNWPETWDRGAGESAPSENGIVIVRPVPEIDPGTLVSRYQNGEHEAVWRDLVSLGAAVRQPRYADPAHTVARETMRRARLNVELLLRRLRELDYEFYQDDSEPYRPPTREEEDALVEAEQGELWIPLSVAAWVREVGWVDFVGSHPTLAFMDDDNGKPGVFTDPLEITCWSLVDISRAWKNRRAGSRKSVRLEIGADAKSKAGFAAGWEASGTYSIVLPNAAADAVLDGAPNGPTFVEYLRRSFEWGGFPAWERYQKRPERELSFLRTDLLPI
jgi:hypothetical protein